MTAAEAAEKWGVSIRQVQRLLAANRIPDVIQYGKRFVIPAYAEKPGSLYFTKQDRKQISLSSDLDHVVAATTLPMPRNNPDTILETVKEKRFRLIYESELAYLRGDFGQLISYYRNTAEDDAVRLRSCPLTIAAAIAMGDYTFYTEIEAYLKGIVKADMGANVTAVAKLSLDTAYVSIVAPNMVSDQLKNGDFSALSNPAKQDAAYKRAKYFYCTAQYESALATAQTALAFCHFGQGISIRDIYLRLITATSCSALGRMDDAKSYLLEAMKIYLPHGFITPFVETTIELKGLFEQCLEHEFPAYHPAITEQWKRTIPNWIDFHNRFTKDNITKILSLRELQIAKLITKRVSRVNIAKQFNISPGGLNNIIEVIYGKLFVTSRNELAKYIL